LMIRSGARQHRKALSPSGWSIYGAKRPQRVATGGKWDDPKKQSDKPIQTGGKESRAT
jgi:hypothetical protein